MRRTTPVRQLLAVALVAPLVAVAVASASAPSAPSPTTAPVSARGVVGTAAADLAATKASANVESAHRFTMLTVIRGIAVRWDSCAAIPWWVSDARIPRGGVRDVRKALHRITATSGQRFVYRGTTSYRPFGSTSPAPPGIVVGFARSSRLIAQGGSAYGTTRTWWRQTSSGYRYQRASVLVAHGLRPGFGRNLTRGVVLMHELGHAVGLGHTRSRHQVMYAGAASVHRKKAVYGAGDRAGLRVVGPHGYCG